MITTHDGFPEEGLRGTKIQPLWLDQQKGSGSFLETEKEERFGDAIVRKFSFGEGKANGKSRGWKFKE